MVPYQSFGKGGPRLVLSGELVRKGRFEQAGIGTIKNFPRIRRIESIVGDELGAIEADLLIELPRGTPLVARVPGGRVAVLGLDAPVEIETGDDDVEAEEIHEDEFDDDSDDSDDSDDDDDGLR